MASPMYSRARSARHRRASVSISVRESLISYAVFCLKKKTRIYAHYGSQGDPSKQENLIVQNAIFLPIAHEAGLLRLPVHTHSGTGGGGYFELVGANPGVLNSLWSESSFRNTTFVLIHGGSGPYA